MTSNSLLDPGLALGKITLRFLQLFLAFCVAILTGMTYLAYQGKLSDWHIQFRLLATST